MPNPGLNSPSNSRIGRSAADLWGLAQQAGDHGRPATAVRLCRRALQRVPVEPAAGPEIHAQILVTLACYQSELGLAHDALSLLDQAISIDPGSSAAVLTARGMVLMRSGDPDAVPALDRAIDALDGVTSRTARPGAGPSDLAAALLNRGLMHMMAGRLDEARRDTIAAEHAATDAGRTRVVLMARHNLGYVAYLAGDLPGALLTMEHAVQVAPGAIDGMQALDRAKVLLSAGLLAEAAEFTAHALGMFRANRAMPDLAEACLVRAEIALLDRQPRAARTYARKATRIYANRGNLPAMLTARLLELRAEAQLRTANPVTSKFKRRAFDDAKDASALAADLAAAGFHELSGTAMLLAVEALLDAGDNPAAALAMATTDQGIRTRSLAIRLHTALVSARIELAAGRRTSGFTQIRRGLDDLADFQARFGSQDLQSAAAVHGRELTRLGLRTAVETGSPAVILQWLERARAVTTRLPEVRPPADPVLAEDLGALRMADDQARAALLAGRRDHAADRRVKELRRRVRARSWTTAGSGRANRPPTLAAVRRALDHHGGNAGVVALFVGDGLIQALVITRSRAATLVLGSRAEFQAQRHRVQGDLDLLADQRIPTRLATVATRSLTDSLQRMSDALAPVLGLVGDGPLLSAAVGPLATVPWLLLPSLHGRPVAVSSSVTRALAGLGTPATAVADCGVLVVAGPDVANGGKEASAIAALYPGADLLTGDQATGQAVLAKIPAGGLVHIAAHGHHEAGNPLFSGVKLADGLLFGYDIAPNPALPGQVVLSSCDVGQTEDRPGGEPLGLVAALVRSGVPTVITGTSRIADSVAEETMVGYHQLLQGGAAPAAALAVAVREAVSSTGLPAPFTCFGAGL